MWSNWKEPEVVATRITGTVKWFNVKAGYGFITRDDTNEDVFVHRTAIMNNNPRKAVASVGDGEILEFDVVIKAKGRPEACNVSGLDGASVEGSSYAADKPTWERATNERQYVKYTSAPLDIPSPQPSPSPTDDWHHSLASYDFSYQSDSSSPSFNSSHSSYSPGEPCPGPVSHALDKFDCSDPACITKSCSTPSRETSDCSSSSCSTPPSSPLDDPDLYDSEYEYVLPSY